MLPTDPPFIPPVTTLETARLSIRIDTHEQYVQKFNSSSDTELKEYFGITSDQELNTQKDKVLGGLTTYRTSLLYFHFVERTLDKVVGSFAYHNWYPMHSRSEIGYAINAPEYKNQGYMREALPPIIAFGFEVLELNRIEAFIDPENIASKKLVERLGFQQEGWLHGRYCYEGVITDALAYGLLQSDFARKV